MASSIAEYDALGSSAPARSSRDGAASSCNCQCNLGASVASRTRFTCQYSYECHRVIFRVERRCLPRISYRVRQSARVQAVVYSTTALIVRRLLDQEQRPGTYEIEWDGRDDKGRLLESGDYVLEVRVGNENVYRKRVILSLQR